MGWHRFIEFTIFSETGGVLGNLKWGKDWNVERGAKKADACFHEWIHLQLISQNKGMDKWELLQHKIWHADFLIIPSSPALTMATVSFPRWYSLSCSLGFSEPDLPFLFLLSNAMHSLLLQERECCCCLEHVDMIEKQKVCMNCELWAWGVRGWVGTCTFSDWVQIDKDWSSLAVDVEIITGRVVHFGHKLCFFSKWRETRNWRHSAILVQMFTKS